MNLKASIPDLSQYGLKFQHVGLIVEDVKEAARFLNLIPGISEWGYIEAEFPAEAMKVGEPCKIIAAVANIGDVTYELVQAIECPESYQAKAAAVRNGFHHVAYAIENREVFDKFVEEMKENYTIVWAADFGDTHGYYFAPADDSGIVLEISDSVPEIEYKPLVID